MSRLAIVGACAAALTVIAPAGAASASPSPHPSAHPAKVKIVTFQNCTAMHKKYPHGVGRVHAHDHTSGKPVTNFFHNDALYKANKKSDRDHDAVACEQR